MAATLKIRLDYNEWRPYTKHRMGGIDVMQEVLFRHLIPEGYIDDWKLDILVDLAAAHGWKLERWDPERDAPWNP